MFTLTKMALDTKMDDEYNGKVNATHFELALAENELDSIEDTASSKFTWLVAIAASVGGMLFGYDTGIISAVLVYIHSDLGRELHSNEKELITSLCSGGAFIGAIIAGLTADKYGRKGAIYAG